MIVIVTLTSPGADTGPFNLFSSVDLINPLATGISRSALIAGYTLNNVPDAATFIRVTSTGICTNSLNINITNPSSPTTTTTTTSAVTPTTTTTTTSGGGGPTTTTTTTAGINHPYEFTISNGYADEVLACGEGSTATTIWGDNPIFLANVIFYATQISNIPYDGNNLYYKNTASGQYVQISSLGQKLNSGLC